MGVGIWSMHFIGMLAFEMPNMVMAYDVPLIVLSILVAVAGSGLALFIVSRDKVPLSSLLAGGIAMAAAIAGMHYIGMYSMRMPASIEWNLPLVVLSIAIALIASFGALLLLIQLREKADHHLQLILASLVMGAAIAGMHYTGMVAATFRHTENIDINPSHLLVSSGLAASVFTTTLLILCLSLAGSIWQRLWIVRSKRQAAALGKSEEKFRLLVEAVKDYSIIMLDTEGRVNTWNSGAERITGYSQQEILGKHISVFYTYEDIENELADTEMKTARESGHFEGEGRRVRKDGSIYWAHIVLTPLLDEKGHVNGYSKVTRDITKVKESELRLRQLNEDLERRVSDRTRELTNSENQLRTITNAIPVLIARLDRNERYVFANDSLCRWLNRSQSEIIGHTVLEVVGPELYPHSAIYIHRALAGETVNYERATWNKNDEAIIGVTLMPEFDPEGDVTGVVVVATDITRHKEVQIELEKAKEAAEVANSAKSAFLANMSHEIRTPLGAVIGFSELLLSNNLGAEEKIECVEIIKRNGLLLSNVINDILDLSKVEAGRLEIERTYVPFDEIMKEMTSVLSLDADKKGIALNVVTEGVIPHQINTDGLRLRQILINIVGNAIKFTNGGFVEVRVKMIPVEDQMKLAFFVKDTGEGIEAEHIDRLFRPFHQADASITRKFGGTGLGLALSRKLANALGGDVSLVESVRGQGSTFMITIDPEISEAVYHQNSTAAPPSAPAAPALIRQPNLKNLNILVVDDSPDNQALITTILRHAGAQVVTACNGQEAVEQALSGDFAVVLMDLQMPVMDGFEATRTLRQRGYSKPIIALTAHAMKEERKRTLSNGFNDHVTKPIDQRALIRTLEGFSA